MVSVNKEAMKIVRKAMDESEKIGIAVHVLKNGATVLDMGVHVLGSWAAGLYFTEVTLGGIGNVSLGRFHLDDDVNLASVDVYADDPVVACLGSQIAGWQISSGEFAVIGSGPARAVARMPQDPYISHISYVDHSDEVVLCLQSTSLPDEIVAEKVAEGCRVDPKNVYLLVAPSASIVGSIQVPARVLEQTMHKLIENDFDPNQVVFAWGSAPVPPVHHDELKAMGRINDALLYGGVADFWVKSDDSECERVVKGLVSEASSEYGKPFEEIFLAHGKDFYKIDPRVHALARVQIHNITSGKCFAAGRINRDVLKRSFGL
ncbi:MAG TPA: methenyltetrahydromethanopterin cyclohydrolase [Clostridia bacterium]|nr:methenyltetrahydromethanopterin cyclohydrolase [Clostridia bacterium]